LPPQQGQVIRNYSTTVPPPGMKILKKNSQEKDARTRQKEKNEAWKLRKAASVNIEANDRESRSAPGQVHSPSQ
jgi:hypothetical protein